jgi:hypothetical protein
MTLDTTSTRNESSGKESPRSSARGGPTTLSQAASIMRNPNSTPEERRLAAALLGREGGRHSHDNDPGRSKVAMTEREKEESYA